VLRAVEQLQGMAIPASALESSVLPARVEGYSPVLLDELTLAGEVVWSGAGAIGADDGWVTLHLAETAPLTLAMPASSPEDDPLLAALGGGALFFRELSQRVGSTDDAQLLAQLWEHVWAGLVTNDTLAPIRMLLRHGRLPAPRASHRATRPGRPRLPSRSGPATASGRWSALPASSTNATRRAHALAEILLDRYGVVTRGVAAAENVPGGFAALYRTLSAFEEAGRCRRGHFVEGLGAAQFALPGAVERLRSTPARSRSWVLAATDPANPYGASLAWPARPDSHRPARRAGAMVVIVDGELGLYLERGGRTALTWPDTDSSLIEASVQALAHNVQERGGDVAIERVNGEPVRASALAAPLLAAGFHPTPRGLRLRATTASLRA
jgi:ATP-dependent Lhr-like helicase